MLYVTPHRKYSATTVDNTTLTLIALSGSCLHGNKTDCSQRPIRLQCVPCKSRDHLRAAPPSSCPNSTDHVSHACSATGAVTGIVTVVYIPPPATLALCNTKNAAFTPGCHGNGHPYNFGILSDQMTSTFSPLILNSKCCDKLFYEIIKTYPH